ncbi:hypothetical protein SCHPADRAFT_937727 [Schizopora paradoxa]|uniref:BTB domain-containing protein n=1 Tax=Schizopora paradoxa TaxID=27342 RepID=A0A0H2SHZ0_9AGAM|nr:hypothetical protein SCHPADRAFT_937727 [Schizopora paradoxa]
MDADKLRCSKGETQTPKPHDLLWFPDGNVVLATDLYLFKVHKSLLSLHSSVFKDMFELSNVGHSAAGESAGEKLQDSYDGLPLITLVGDKGEDVVHLLRAVFEIRYYDYHSDETTLESVIALLLLSTKYDFKDIRTNVILQISRQYPTALKDFDLVDDDKTLLFGELREDCRFALLGAAYRANAHVLLPTLYFACSKTSIQHIIEESTRRGVPAECLYALLEGRERLLLNFYKQAASTERIVESAMTHLTCIGGDNGSLSCLRDLLLSGVDFGQMSTDVNLHFARRSPELFGFFNQACETCKTFMEGRVTWKRNDVWDKLPSNFGCLNWDVIQEQLEEMAKL